ncbi:MAG TPA: hypothetical protein VFN67_20920 [Polyangiales bacterium]|nr:hypothetical protein [Polyangiales bacterium]
MNVTLASVWERTSLITRGALFALAVSACGQATTDGAQTSVTDTATAYEALSNKVKDCRDDQDACVTAAAGDATKVAECDAAAESCVEKTRDAQADARKHLRDDAEGCVRECRRHRGDSDGGVDEGGRMDTRGCMGRRAPIDSECMDAFFMCLDDTGVRMSGGAGDLDDATKEAIQKCVETAHTCMMSDMRTGRGPGRRGPGMRGGAGEPAHTAGAGAGRRPRDEAGAGGSGRRSRDEAGAGGDEDNGGRRGPGRGAAGGAPDRGGRRQSAGGAGGS